MNHIYSMCKTVLLCLVVSLLLANLKVSGQQVAVSLVGKNVTNSDGAYEFVPASYSSSKDSFPLLIFIHGIGELGNGTTNLPSVLKNGVPKLIANGTFPASFTVGGQTFSFIVVSPQFKNIPSPLDVLSLINYLKKKYRIDNNRIYVTGLSMGGGATEDFASANDSYAQIPAAVVAVAGNMNPRIITNAPNIVAKNKVPEWFLHNESDPTVPSQYSKDWVSMISAYKPATTPQPKLTIFNASGHDAWTKAYDPAYKENGLNVYEWMLQYEKGKAAVPSSPNQSTPAPGNKRVVAKTNIGNGMYYPDAMTSFGLKPGDTLCISGGDYEFIQLGQLVGTAAKPIVITNCGGQVRIGIKTLKSDVAFSANGGRYIEISGSGTPGVEYGFDVNGKNLLGVQMTGMYLGLGASDFNVHNIYFHDASNFIVAKTTQECTNSQFWEGAYVMKNCKIHHIKGRYSQYEGFYIGNTHYIMDYLLCQGIKSHHIQDLEVYDNDIQHTGYDGIQIAMCDLGENKIHDNIVRYYGEQKLDAQSYGMLMGGGSRVKLYNNVIDNGYLPGIALFGSGVSYVYNNTVSNVTHGEGINVSDKLILQPVTAYIFNNTIYNTGPTGIKIYADLTTVGHKVYNNLVINKGGTGDYPMNGFYIRGNNTIKFDFGNNQFYTTPALAKVVDAASLNFQLSSTAAAIDAGKTITEVALNFDAANLPRPVNGKYDVGAYEYQGAGTTPVNRPPVANAGNAITITLPVSTVTLNGSSSSDPDGTISTYLWKKVSGPTTGVITSSTSATTTVTGLTAGTYLFQLSVTDNNKVTSLDSVTVKVNPAANRAPVANAGSAITITLPVSTATLNGSSSSDPDGTISTYAWKKVSGPTSGVITSSAAAQTTVTGLTAGTYVFQLSVTDNSKATSLDSVTVKVNAAANKPPVANAGKSVTITLPENTVTLNGSTSSDADGTIVTYAWKKVSGPAGGVIAGSTFAKTSATGLTAGTYVFQLSVTDNKNATSLDSITVKVNAAANIPPVANAGSTITITLPVSSITLNGSSSSDADGTISKYAWTKVSGPAGGVITNSASAKTTVTGLIAGTYVFQLSVTDNSNATDLSSVTVKVNAANSSVNIAPVANAGNDIAATSPVSTVTLNGSASKDADGTIVTYYWEKISGPDVRFSDANANVNVVSGMAAGNYVFRLTVTDNQKAIGIDYVNVSIAKSATTNVDPVSNAGGDITIKLPANSVTLDGSASKDADGSIVSYLWQKISGKDVRFSDATGVRNTVSELAEGSYVFQLIVTDNNGATSYSTKNVTVQPAAKAAVIASTQGNLSLTLPESSITADGSSSYSAGGEITTYTWKQLAGPANIDIWTPREKSTRLGSFVVEGDYVFELTVTDNNNSSSSTTFNISALKGGKNSIGFVPEITIFPNPAVNVLHFKQKLENATGIYITISNVAGKVVKTYVLPASDMLQEDLDVSSLPAGIYFLQAQYKNSGYKMSFKFIKAD